MLLWFSRLPLTLRLPLLVAAMIFIAAVVTTQVAVRSTSAQFEDQIERIGQVYLDGLAAAVMPAVAVNDVASMTAVLRRALTVHVGIQDRRLAILDAGSRIVAQAQRADMDSLHRPGSPAGHDASTTDPTRSRQLPAQVGSAAAGTLFDPADSSVWVWRPLPPTATTAGSGTIIANLDIGRFLAERQQLRWSLLLFDLILSGSASQREAMLGRLVDQERDAVLGRLAATLAHEIRNPLGGMSAAIRTLHKFGHEAKARAEALDFIERGVVALQEVTDATLKTHRPAEMTRRLRLQDLHDVKLLAGADAGRRDVDVELDVDLPPEVPVPATEVRQLLLNLLLNAVRATSPGGVVTLRARLQEDALLLEVIDQGSGLAAEVTRGMTSGIAPPGNPGLGVAVVIRLVERLQGRVSVASRSQGGTHIALTLPLTSTTTVTSSWPRC